MKKLFLGAIFTLAIAGTATAQTDNKVQTPQTPATTTTTVTVPATTTDAAAQPAQTAPATATASTNAADGGKEFTKIEQNDISQVVLREAVAKYNEYALVEALASTDGSQYKLVLTKDGKDIAAYYKANGEFIKEVAA